MQPQLNFIHKHPEIALITKRLWIEFQEWGVDPPLYFKGIIKNNPYQGMDYSGLPLRDRVALIRAPLSWAQWVVETYHYKKKRVFPKALPFAYAVLLDGDAVGVLIAGKPRHHKQKGLFGYPGLITEWQVLTLNRMWLHPSVQGIGYAACPLEASIGRIHAFSVGSCALGKLCKVIQRDWLLHHPPRDLSEPYHLRLLISYAEKSQGHEGTVYQASGFEQYGETRDGEKWIWLKRFPAPEWTPTISHLTLIDNYG